jgi:hypothetical protein
MQHGWCGRKRGAHIVRNDLQLPPARILPLELCL